MRCRWTVGLHKGRESDHVRTYRFCIMQWVSHLHQLVPIVSACALALWGCTYVEDCVDSIAVPTSSAEQVCNLNGEEWQISNFSYLERVGATFHLSVLNIFYVSVTDGSRRNVALLALTQSKCVHQSRERFANVPSLFLMLHWPWRLSIADFSLRKIYSYYDNFNVDFFPGHFVFLWRQSR
jgi:hypothetical protein